ncbi:hypothetical protein GUJ93_ZPchr0009g1813 [Zizania palustris]|uniref:Uncharacterized protein n=1 Tax=Zizania palustris TaxID=103762 RepID=A0A8J5RMQ1_ZIZPA|nr:hypothetical protein GUJ93_ZPchr0009g1813 [Zizania palustris]
MDVRKHAARIVAHLAEDIRLASFPHGTRCISSLLEMISHSEQRNYDREFFMLQGLNILHKLAADEHNRRIISSAQELLSKAMAPVRADLLDCIVDHQHQTLSEIVIAWLKLMSRFVTAPDETGAKLRSQVVNNRNAIIAMKKILGCGECNEMNLDIEAIEILIMLPMAPADWSLSMSTQTIEKSINLLVTIFTDEGNATSIGLFRRHMAGEALAVLSDLSESC